NTMGGFKAQGLSDAAADRILQDAIAHEKAGAWGAVLEGIAEPLAQKITQSVSIPTIGIGASLHCDGQVLVTEDILGLSGMRLPRFAKSFVDAAESISSGIQSYADEVRAGDFPSLEHCFGVKKP